jgi:hypothetical protein
MTSVVLLLGGMLAFAVGNFPVIGRTAPAPSAGGCSPGRSSSGEALPAPDTVRVNVYNATSRQGLAGSLAASLRGQGFTVLTVGNDPRHSHLKGRGEIRYGARGALAAQTAHVWMAGVKLVKDHRRDATIDVVAGKRFSGLRSPPPPPVLSGAAGAGRPASGC